MSRHTTPDERTGQLELTRAPNDHRLYSLAGIGTIRREGSMFSQSYIADAAGHRWRFTSRGPMQQRLEATASNGTIAGTFLTKAIRRSGQLDWETEQLEVKPASLGRERYVLSSNSRDIILFEGKSWGHHPVKVTIVHPSVTDSGLVLFAAFVVHRLAINAASTAGFVAAAAASSTSS